ncbi:hypothetical protein T05_11842 [Trichinella murrelli]|uniref:Uncharacterized protein n=1 Tax=Trichinella murrelli TaxID=144512 RepID=A0A0V0TZ61_9BILA|nr:hypothetical protein T05_11842 [Trichinella murrelli]
MRDEEPSCARPAIAENGPTNRWPVECFSGGCLDHHRRDSPDLCTGVMKINGGQGYVKCMRISGCSSGCIMMQLQQKKSTVQFSLSPREKLSSVLPDAPGSCKSHTIFRHNFSHRHLHCAQFLRNVPYLRRGCQAAAVKKIYVKIVSELPYPERRFTGFGVLFGNWLITSAILLANYSDKSSHE